MKQLTGLDAAFLYMETPTTFGHVTGLMIFERPSTGLRPVRGGVRQVRVAGRSARAAAPALGRGAVRT